MARGQRTRGASRIGTFGPLLVVATIAALWLLLYHVSYHLPGLKARLSPFHEAVFAGRYDEARAFLDRGVDPNGRAGDGGNALSIALLNRDWRMAGLLVDRGADVDARPRGNSLLLDMVYANERQGYEWLLRHGARRDPEAEALLRTPERKWH